MRHHKKHAQIVAHLGLQNFPAFVVDMYQNKQMSSHEIAEYIAQNTGISITPKSIQRAVQKHGTPRNAKTAYNLAIQHGRVQWASKTFKIKRKRLSDKLRYVVLKRDNFRCVLCGRGSDRDLLEVYHITPICDGGLTAADNLRTLCYSCNRGKQYAENER